MCTTEESPCPVQSNQDRQSIGHPNTSTGRLKSTSRCSGSKPVGSYLSLKTFRAKTVVSYSVLSPAKSQSGLRNLRVHRDYHLDRLNMRAECEDPSRQHHHEGYTQDHSNINESVPIIIQTVGNRLGAGRDLLRFLSPRALHPGSRGQSMRPSPSSSTRLLQAGLPNGWSSNGLFPMSNLGSSSSMRPSSSLSI